ncbi:MAG: hypothetical protein M3490_09225 [Chloroflexota bacterium]|nr:hypothetical protein [Chloroflexota bacterium]
MHSVPARLGAKRLERHPVDPNHDTGQMFPDFLPGLPPLELGPAKPGLIRFRSGVPPSTAFRI